MRIFAISDLHCDYRENWAYLSNLSDGDFRGDVLIVAGDIGHRIELIAGTLELLCGKFARVCYVPGNHELWVRGEGGDSLGKFHRILEMCDELGVLTRPVKIGEYQVVPLFSWYDESFDEEDKGNVEALEGWGDFHYCRWPESMDSQALFFARMNESNIVSYSDQVVSFSHFLPRRELLPDVDYLRFKGLPKVAGCHSIEGQIRKLGAAIHVFGHSHIRRDLVLDGVRYVQHGLGYPRERRGREFVLKQIC